MTTYVGVDWASKYWVAVALTDDGDCEADAYPSILNVWHKYQDAESILVDIPIGLPDDELRDCDKLAKKGLGSHGSSIFYTPCREAVEVNSYEKATKINKDTLDRGISAQSWGITRRIKEVDVFLQEFENAGWKVRESHPEVCFSALNGGPLEHSKLGDDGKDERLDILEEAERGMRKKYESIVEEKIEVAPSFARPISTNARDDVLDALALALTAKKSKGDFETIPENPPEDDTGHRMEIVYYDAYESFNSMSSLASPPPI